LTVPPITWIPRTPALPGPRDEQAPSAGSRSSDGSPLATERVSVDGRHLCRSGRPFRVRGVTYGSFAPRGDGAEFPEAAQLRRDLETIAGLGFNAIRTYTLPPRDLLEAAAACGLLVHVGLHYPDWRSVAGTGRSAGRRVLDGGLRAVETAVARLTGRDEVLAISVGNEVPSDLVRLHGAHGRFGVEAVLGRLVDELHAADPAQLVSYGSYPSTEYLTVPGLDLATFNVFLTDPADLRRYLRHLAVAVGEIPLLIGELGVELPAGAGGIEHEQEQEQEQAQALAGQLAVVDESGCAGGFVFSWTDDWVVGGEQVSDWRFGLTTHDRRPRPAAALAGAWARRSVRDQRAMWPSLTVVVCAYNEADNLPACLASLEDVDYPGFEVLVVDDGSTDATVEVSRRYPFRVLEVAHQGLSVARNAGARAANGEIVAFLDADATCHPEWPYHLARAMAEDGVVAAGGPNLPRPAAGLVERAVAHSPGNPVEVLATPDRAEHVPGCNCAIRRDVLLASGGFQQEFTAAGDDVDLFWRIIDAGSHVGFSAAAQVRHARRATVRGYLRQQRGYGRAERMVSGRHPHRFNRAGHAVWAGSLYGGPSMLTGPRRAVVDHGRAGGAPFQPRSVVRDYSAVHALPGALPFLLGLAVVAAGLAILTPLALLVTAAALAVVGGYASFVAACLTLAKDEPQPRRVRLLAACLHVLQPLARAWGRWGTVPLPMLARPPVAPGDRLGWVDALHVALAGARCRVRRGSGTDRHDLAAAVGWLISARLTTGLRWNCHPLLKIRLRPGRALVALAPLWIAAFAVVPECAAAAGTSLAVLAGTEAFVLRRRINASATATAPRAVRP
jgi:glycosyltransferase involved in cell wall biosynthesis